MRIFFSWLFILFLLLYVDSVSGQTSTQLERYFPSYVLPETWFDNILTSEEYADFSQRKQQVNNLFQGYANFLPYYSFERFTPKELLQQLISRGLIRSKLDDLSFNVLRSQYFSSNRSSYNWHALSMFYRPQPVYDLTEIEDKTLISSYDKQKVFLEHPSGGADSILSWFKKNGYSRERFVRNLIHENPSFIDKHWDEIPDAPKIFGLGQKIDPKTYRGGLEVVMRREMDISSPKKLEKIEIIENSLKISGSENIQFSQSYVENWVKGGQSSIALLSDLRLKIVYKNDKIEWENSIIHKMGVISSEDSKSRINDDLIDFSSKYGIIASKKWFYSLLFNFKTQVFNGYAKNDLEKEKPISAFMAPGYFSMAAGMDYKTKNFTLLLSPVTSRMTIVVDTAKIDQTRYSIPEDKKSVFLVGGSLQNNFSWNISKQIKLTSAFNIFYDYFEKEEKVQADWDMILDMKINVFLSTRIVSNLRYYESESDKVQLREGLSISFRYNF